MVPVLFFACGENAVFLIPFIEETVSPLCILGSFVVLTVDYICMGLFQVLNSVPLTMSVLMTVLYCFEIRECAAQLCFSFLLKIFEYFRAF